MCSLVTRSRPQRGDHELRQPTGVCLILSSEAGAMNPSAREASLYSVFVSTQG